MTHNIRILIEFQFEEEVNFKTHAERNGWNAWLAFIKVPKIKIEIIFVSLYYLFKLIHVMS